MHRVQQHKPSTIWAASSIYSQAEHPRLPATIASPHLPSFSAVTAPHCHRRRLATKPWWYDRSNCSHNPQTTLPPPFHFHHLLSSPPGGNYPTPPSSPLTATNPSSSRPSISTAPLATSISSEETPCTARLLPIYHYQPIYLPPLARNGAGHQLRRRRRSSSGRIRWRVIPAAPRGRVPPAEEAHHLRHPRRRPVKEQRTCRPRGGRCQVFRLGGGHAGEEAGGSGEVGGRQLEIEEGAAAPRIPEPGGAGHGAQDHRNVPAGRVRRRGAPPRGAHGRGCHGPRLRPPGRRLRRELQGVPRQQYPWHLPYSAPDGRRAHVRWSGAGRQGTNQHIKATTKFRSPGMTFCQIWSDLFQLCCAW